VISVKFKRLPHGQDLPLPGRATPGSAGMDICSAIDRTIGPSNGLLFNTGFMVEIPEGYELQVRSRSGLANSGIFVTNSPGTIDADYRGEICVLLTNLTPSPYAIRRGDRIAQLVLNKLPEYEVKEVEKLSETKRGDGGFGSTGK
jgi:dUTP pyrophosphatase